MTESVGEKHRAEYAVKTSRRSSVSLYATNSTRRSRRCVIVVRGGAQRLHTQRSVQRQRKERQWTRELR